MYWNNNRNKLKRMIEGKGKKNILVHSDSFKAMSFVDLSLCTSPSSIYDSHCEFLNSISENIYLPCFNYDFPKTKVFDFLNFRSQVGVIPELYEARFGAVRSFDPMFSMIQPQHDNEFIGYKEKVDSFSIHGPFEKFKEKDGALLFYGSDISSMTFIHYLETVMDSPYRYKKSISGVARLSEGNKPLLFSSHFRPLGHYFQYDWKKIEMDLLSQGIITEICKGSYLIDSMEFYSFSKDKLYDDPLYYLDKKTEYWVQNKLEQLGRRFKQCDFE